MIYCYWRTELTGKQTTEKSYEIRFSELDRCMKNMTEQASECRVCLSVC